MPTYKVGRVLDQVVQPADALDTFATPEAFDAITASSHLDVCLDREASRFGFSVESRGHVHSLSYPNSRQASLSHLQNILSISSPRPNHVCELD